MNIGFIGLGIMGRPMALNLKKAGHDLIVPERKSLNDEIRGAAQVVADNRAVAAEAEVLILMVPDTPDVEAVLFGEGGAAEGLKTRHAGHRHVLDQPDRHQGICQKGQRAGLRLSGRASLRRRGRRQTGDADHHGRRPGSRVRTGEAAVRGDGQEHHPCRAENGDGQTCKVANQIIVALNIQAVSEALVFAAKAGRRSGQGAAGPDGRLRVLAHPGGSRRTHDQRHVQSRASASGCTRRT